MDVIALAIGCVAMIVIAYIWWFLHQFAEYVDHLIEYHNARLIMLETKGDETKGD